jgi:hypothetical protein
VNEQLIRQVIDALAAAGPRHVQVCCPRGHFITTAELSVEGDQIIMGTSRPYAKPDADEPRGAFVIPVPGRQWQDHNRQLRCTHRRCRYNVAIQYDVLAVELAVAALAGHHEHRLTT